MSKRNEIIQIASGEVGYKEYSDNHTKYGEWFGMQDEWCAIFVSWLANQVGILNNLIPKQSYVPTMVSWFKNKGLFKSRGSLVSKGDIIFFDYNFNGTPDHVGIVEKIENGIITTIEGNKSKMVKRCTYNINNNGIFGFGIVKYTDDEVEPTPAPSTGKIATIQTTLNERYSCGLTVDNLFGPKTKAALVKALQKELGMPSTNIDGIFGPITKSYCLNIRYGATGNLVWLIQAMLVCKKYNIAVDSIFGNDTLNAIKNFQRASRITVDGIVGKNTFEKLFI